MGQGKLPAAPFLGSLLSGTALRGVSRIALFARQVVATAVFGLAAELDAYFLALTMLSILVVQFGDLLDAVGQPELVRADLERGPRAVAGLERWLLGRSLMGGATLTGLALLLAISLPEAWLSGAEGTRRALVENLVLLVPYGIGFLPFLCLGAIFHSRRRLALPGLAEAVLAVVALVALVAGRSSDASMALSLSVGCLVGLALLYAAWRSRWPGPDVVEPSPEVRRDLLRRFGVLAPGLLASQMAIFVDRSFAIRFGPGCLSAITFGLLLALVVPDLFNLKSVLVASFMRSADRTAALTRFLSAVVVTTAPLALFVAWRARGFVQLLLGRGQFDLEDLHLTTLAVRWFACALPPLMLVPVGLRLLQIEKRHGTVNLVSILGLVGTVALEWAAVAPLDAGFEGLTMAAGASRWFVLAAVLVALWRSGFRVDVGAVAIVAGASIVALAAAVAVDSSLGPASGLSLVLRGPLFVAAYAAVLVVLPGRELAAIRGEAWGLISKRARAATSRGPEPPAV